MLDFLKTKIQPIGLDISTSSVRMLQLQINDGQIAVIAADEQQLEPEMLEDEQTARQVTIAAIREMLSRSDFHKRQVVSSLPSSKLIIKSLRVDSFNDSEIEKSLTANTLERFGLNNDTHEIRFLSAGSVKQGEEMKNEIILLAVEKTAIDEQIKMLEEAGLVPAAIDTVPCALFRSLQRSLRRVADRENTNVFVDVGSSHTTMIIGKAGEIMFAKQIDIASDTINKQVASRLGIGLDEAIHLRSKLRRQEQTDEIEPAMKQIVVDSMHSVIDELAREIGLCFRYYSVTFRGQRPGQIVFAGGEAYEQTLIKALKRHLGIEITVTEPFRGFDLSKVEMPADKRSMLCEWAVATGLCLKGIEKDKSYERN